MKTLFKTAKAALMFPLLVVASQASAHGIESKTILLPTVGSGATADLIHTCLNGHAYSGGYTNDSGSVSFDVSGSFPSATDTWTIRLTNVSGRQTGAQEVTMTIHVLCGGVHKH